MFYLKLFKLEIKPITPSELILKKPITKNMELMVNTINELIIERFDGTQITIEKEDIIERFY